MGTEYDAGKIRALARQISRAASEVADVNANSLKGVLKEMPDNFQGSAAAALQESVGELMSDIRSISSHLSAVSSALYKLAARVEYADQQAKNAITSK